MRGRRRRPCTLDVTCIKAMGLKPPVRFNMKTTFDRSRGQSKLPSIMKISCRKHSRPSSGSSSN
eukprot:5219165-Pyramimonas_sp.AAC.1